MRIRKTVVALVFICLSAALAFAQGTKLYGRVAATCAQAAWNPSGLRAGSYRDSSGMSAGILADMSLSMSDGNLGSFYLNAYAAGGLGQAPTDALSLTLGQCYFQVPLGSLALLTAGKKNKSIGYANFYNLSNRLTPREGGASGATAAIGLGELDFFPSDFLAVELIGYLQDVAAWQDASVAIGAKLQAGVVDADVYAYLEELENASLGCAVSAQLDRLKVYAEAIVSDRSQRKTLVADPVGAGSDDFAYEAVPSTQAAVGAALSAGPAALCLEYSYRSDGPDSGQRRRLIDYVKGLAGEALKSSAIGAFYLEPSFGTHFLAFSGAQDLIEELLKSKTVISLSAGKEIAEWQESLGAKIDYSLTLEPVENLSVEIFLSFALGGASSEYGLFSAYGAYGGIRCAYSFAGK